DARHRLDAVGHALGRGGRRGRPQGPAPRGRGRGGHAHADGDRRGRPRGRLRRAGARREAAAHGVRSSRVQGGRPAGGDPARHGRGGLPPVGPVQVVRDGRQAPRAHQRRQGAHPERGLLLGAPLLLARHPRGSLHARDRGGTHRRLDGEHPRAARRQPAHPPARRVRRPEAARIRLGGQTCLKQATRSQWNEKRHPDRRRVAPRLGPPTDGTRLADPVTVKQSLTRKLIESHLASGKPVAGEEIGLAVDQALLTDTNGTMAWLQFEAMGFPHVVPSCVVTYIDHNVYQVDSRNSDDHRYLQTAARRYGAIFSKPGNGICHQVHLESFSVPGQTLLGTDSHTPLCGAAGMLAIGAGGLDVAVAMGGGPYSFTMPAVVRVWLTGELGPWVTAKDVILEMLRRFSVRGGAGKIFEYAGPGVAALSLPQRMTIANMGAELGLTTSVFPSDAVTRDYFRRLHRKHAWTPQAADEDAEYDEQIALDLSAPTCGSCAGIGHVPAAGTKSLRAFNRNFPGRSGVKGDEVYLCSSVTAAASALTGTITDPRTAGTPAAPYLPESFATSSAGL